MRHIIIVILALWITSCRHQEKQASSVAVINEPAKVSATIVPDTSRVMIHFNGGKIKLGSQNLPNESPAFDTIIKPFSLDKHLVTVNQFREFVNSTGYVTQAEQYGDAGVFDINSQQWALLKGATWKYPLGPGQPEAHDDYPVTQVSWNDAIAYCKWAGLRLPDEAEWEYAARNGKNTDDPYSWGKSLIAGGRYKANVWEGDRSVKQGSDGFIYTSPVGFYGETASGLTDMGGNIWQWCADTYRHYRGNKVPFVFHSENKIIRGGSFFFDEAGEKSYTVSFRGNNTAETSLFNIGFRCAGN